jgi:hypothetical protein
MKLDEEKVNFIKLSEKVDIDYSFQKSVSFSQYQVYSQCPFRWKLQYIDKKTQFEPSIFAVFGTAMHTTIQDYLTNLFEHSERVADETDLEEYFKTQFILEYEKTLKSNSGVHFSNPEEMREFFDDGLEIVRIFKKDRKRYFNRKGWKLVGIEIPITYPANDTHQNVYIKGYLDIVLYNEEENRLLIIDVKTSMFGWVKEKKDPFKTDQLILYKSYFSRQFQVPVENIDIQYFILKRKLYENTDYIQSRIQLFEPPSGKIKQNSIKKSISDFVSETFNLDGTHNIEKTYPKEPSPKNCKYCPFSKDKSICDRKKPKIQPVKTL